MWLVDWIFPKNCVGCDDEGAWLCTSCLAKIESRVTPIGCADCGTITRGGRYCDQHAPDHKLTGLVVVQPFHKGTLREAIHTLKYNGVYELAQPLGRLLKKRLEQYPHLTDHIIVAIPLHKKREQKRGFNQAKLIADQVISGQTRADQIIQRARVTATQASLSHEERKTNLKGVFRVHPKYSIRVQDQDILLIDDVATTTATLDEAAGVLLEAGASSVWGAVIAKG